MQQAALSHDDRKSAYILNHAQHFRIKPAPHIAATETQQSSNDLL